MQKTNEIPTLMWVFLGSTWVCLLCAAGLSFVKQAPHTHQVCYYETGVN